MLHKMIKFIDTMLLGATTQSHGHQDLASVCAPSTSPRTGIFDLQSL